MCSEFGNRQLCLFERGLSLPHGQLGLKCVDARHIAGPQAPVYIRGEGAPLIQLAHRRVSFNACERRQRANFAHFARKLESGQALLTAEGGAVSCYLRRGRTADAAGPQRHRKLGLVFTQPAVGVEPVGAVCKRQAGRTSGERRGRPVSGIQLGTAVVLRAIGRAERPGRIYRFAQRRRG